MLWEEELDTLLIPSEEVLNQLQSDQAPQNASNSQFPQAVASFPVAGQGTGGQQYTHQAPQQFNQTATGTTGRATKKEGKNGKKVEDINDKKAKRRAAVAAASRATRAKRKRELEELKQKNKRLELEREAFLNTIAELQMNVQALRETGSIDLRMENDLLRAELNEHKKFISQFKSVADGLPTTKNGKRVLMLQGADTAVSQVLGLISTSMVDPSWRHGRIASYPQMRMRYQRLPHGSTCKSAKRLTFRIDLPFIPVSAEELAEIMWSVWVESDLAMRVNKHFNQGVSVAIKEVDIGLGKDFDTQPGVFPKPGKNKNGGASERGRIKAYYYRETRPERPKLTEANENEKTDKSKDDMYQKHILPPTELKVANPGGAVVDTVLVLTGRQADVSLSSFPPDFVEGTNPVDESEKANEKVKAISGTKGTVPAVVLASTSTQHSLDIEPLRPGVARIQSAVLEGSAIRKLKGGCAFTGIYSYPLNPNTTDPAFLSTTQGDGIVNDDGYFTPVWEEIIKEMVSIIAENVPGFVDKDFQEQMKLPVTA
mmetsp:Transcript_6594/g.7548  ORF Transcript_6594/g.7548 Transcript_6594/m.7548 type:complete len:542 (-) Transcript_6594:2232-3857(-)|eukprot:CAMPEP_0184009938 /NCGR_PEP_ID=MMETSP0954-20121128/2908_1 /TAXON_ID=627963 /ORGANISM="Aplanochytrium sp, Strain PBS07" /LENGTH=541 /DNA_ID=CAMNT_0026289417 /DNA_START=450 /DNA_END=2075 /DNA_ORIENTATION=+